MADELTQTLLQLVDDALPLARTGEVADRLRSIRTRLQGPLRLALAGKVKAGKSTLLNALLGEELAPTDASECTKIVTWYRHDTSPTVVLHPREGEPRPVLFRRPHGALEADLGGRSAQEVDHLEVGWPTDRLRELTLIDTPGIASISTEVSARAHDALAGGHDRPSVADAVLYLMRHTHASDVHFLEAFHREELSHGTPINSVGVLSRADEIGSCQSDALVVAARVARRYQEEPRLRRLCPIVLPVAGLLGYAGATLREAEYAALAEIAHASADQRDELLLTADRFASRPSTVPVTELERQHLLNRLGLFGVRMGVELIRTGQCTTTAALADDLSENSGLTRLRQVLAHQFTDRSRVLKVRSALKALEPLLQEGCHDSRGLSARLEEITSSAHEVREVRVLERLRSGQVSLPEPLDEELDRVLGGSGLDPASRLGLGADATVEEVRLATRTALAAWHRVAANPIAGRSLQLAATTAIRTLEGLYASVEGVTA
jgi:50S ribosome-binding GTPase